MEQSSLGRIVGVLLSPTKTFAAINERPTWVVALIVLIVAGLAVAYLATDRIDMEEAVRESLARQGGGQQLNDAQIERMVGVQRVVGGIVGPIVFGAAFYFLAALIFWMGFKLSGADFSYIKGLAVTLYGYMPGVIKALLTVPIILGRGELDPEEVQAGALLKSNLAALAPEDAGLVMKSLLSSVDLFSIWIVVLLAIGFSIVAKKTVKSAAITVLVVWLIGVAAKLGFAALGEAFS